MKMILFLIYLAELVCSIVMYVLYSGVFLLSPLLTLLVMGIIYTIVFIFKKEIKRKKIYIAIHIIIIVTVPIILFLIRPEYTQLDAYKILISENTELADYDTKEETVTSSEDDNVFHLSYYYFKFTFINEEDDGVTEYLNTIYVFDPWTGSYFELSD